MQMRLLIKTSGNKSHSSKSKDLTLDEDGVPHGIPIKSSCRAIALP